MRHTCRHGKCGAASVEAVVVLPVFVILFVGMFFVRDLNATRLAADEEVRRCSWEYALANDCGYKPAGCGEVVGDAQHGPLTPDLDKLFNDFGKGSQSVGTKGFQAVQRILEHFVVDYLAQAVTRRFDANKSIERDRPNLFGGGKTRVSGKYGLSCNVPAQGQNSVMTTIWDQFKP